MKKDYTNLRLYQETNPDKTATLDELEDVARATVLKGSCYDIPNTKRNTAYFYPFIFANKLEVKHGKKD